MRRLLASVLNFCAGLAAHLRTILIMLASGRSPHAPSFGFSSLLKKEGRGSALDPSCVVRRARSSRDEHAVRMTGPKGPRPHPLSDWIAKALPLLGSRGKAPGLLSLHHERSTSTLFRSLLDPFQADCGLKSARSSSLTAPPPCPILDPKPIRVQRPVQVSCQIRQCRPARL